ncbi:MAG TPA: ABC-type transport auxiliary lipoprotein family protein [Polyangiaceae bacterium]|nr:ABC-type transport auxiliary lipoprotein family protein [Polyangiaceae bacterium]
MTPRPSALAPLAALWLSACALTGKSAPLEPRYFDVEAAAREGGAPPAPGACARPAPGAAPAVRLARVRSGADLRERIALRRSEFEIGYYEDRRWTEKPEAFLRRALTRALYEECGLERAVQPGGPSLEVELTAFEEVKAPRHLARVRAAAFFYDERRVRFERTLGAERPVAVGGDEADAVARAMAGALDDLVRRIARDVSGELAPAPEAGGVP